MLLKEIPDDVVAGNVQGRLAQGREKRLLAGPGVTAVFDRVEDDLRAVLAGWIVGATDGGAVAGVAVGQSRGSRLGRTTVQPTPVLHGVGHRFERLKRAGVLAVVLHDGVGRPMELKYGNRTLRFGVWQGH